MYERSDSEQMKENISTRLRIVPNSMITELGNIRSLPLHKFQRKMVKMTHAYKPNALKSKTKIDFL